MTRITKIQTIVGAVALTLASGISFAGGMGAEHGMKKLPSFSELDADGDGKISQSEAAGSKLQEHWTSVDTDGSQAIDQSEFSAFEEQKMEYKQEGQTGGQLEGGSETQPQVQPEGQKQY